MLKWLIVALALNVLDGLLTIHVCSSGIAEELNPLMGFLLEKGELYFLLVKVSLGSLALFLLYRIRAESLARGCLIACTFLFFLVDLLHVWILITST